ncbi:MAG: exonuclease SbcCD subunit D [Chloroflexi bacterium]|nr:exonuclease SbcCD subunit D [Chloroflexota bacterium]MCY3717181.1 exonuclease SbcCD subunit D [Chloroflexota bacterium]MDE2650398.1 exonuclease SbcCD subunit D [Chloroflexota bacterium]MXV93953.1 exonuclease SbcCD subunit D [Chloroflexota bacterium]MXX51078.1 exonuclease SbcCD subunit D [Chloroflexota bacterium]
MQSPIRVLHFADAHIGMANFGKTDPQRGISSRIVDFLARLDEMIDFAEAHAADLVVFAGDAFRSRSPNPTLQREFAKRVLRLSRLAPTLLLAGNHDLPLNAAKAASIEIFDTLGLAGVWVAQEYETRRIPTRAGDVVVGAAPYPLRARLLKDSHQRARTIAEQDEALKQALTEQLTALAQQAQALAKDTAPKLLTGHFSLEGALWGSERGVMLGRDVAVGLDCLADAGWDYVALGHIHQHQNLTHGQDDKPPVVYSGSIERIDFGEEGTPKGFCWVELRRGEANWQFVPLQARKLLTIEVDCRASLDPTQDVLAALEAQDLRDAVLRLHITLSPQSEALLNDGQIQRALRQSGLFHLAGLRKEIQRSTRARLGKSAEELSPLQLLGRYFESREVDAFRREELLNIARGIVDGA